jgi:hypothetical protein
MNTKTEKVQVPAEYQAELDRFRQAAVRNIKPVLMGQVLRFRKGDWVFGGEKKKIAAGTRFIGIMNEARHGWIKWNADKTAVHIVGRIVDNFTPPPLEELDCRDKSTWKPGLNGELQDPWQPVCYLPLASLDLAQLLTFSTMTRTGRPSFWALMDRYQWLARKHAGKYPIIEIQNGGYEDKRFGWVDVPKFEIVDWTGRPDLQQLTGGSYREEPNEPAADEAAPDNDLDDEIPF